MQCLGLTLFQVLQIFKDPNHSGKLYVYLFISGLSIRLLQVILAM